MLFLTNASLSLGFGELLSYVQIDESNGNRKIKEFVSSYTFDTYNLCILLSIRCHRRFNFI
jgi:hypothetical protein